MSDSIRYVPDYELLKKYFINGPNYNIHAFTWRKESFFEGERTISTSTADMLKALSSEYTSGRHLNELYWLSEFIHKEQIIKDILIPTDNNHEIMVEKIRLHDFFATMKSMKRQIGKIILIDNKADECQISSNRILIGQLSSTFEDLIKNDPDLSHEIYDINLLHPEQGPVRIIDANRKINFPGSGNRHDASALLSKYKSELLKTLRHFFKSEGIIKPRHTLIFLAKMLFICGLPERSRDGIEKDPYTLKGYEQKVLSNQIRDYLKDKKN